MRRAYLHHFKTELAALQALPRRPSFPELVGFVEDSRRLVTAPLAEPLCPVVGEGPRFLCMLGFAAYAALVEDLKLLHAPLQGAAQVFHCDVAPHNLAWYPAERLILLIDFGCAVVSKESVTTVPYSGSMWYASSAALDQLTADRGTGTDGEAIPTNSWAGEVHVDPSFDLEGLAKSVAALEVPGVAEFIDRDSNRVCTARKKAEVDRIPAAGRQGALESRVRASPALEGAGAAVRRGQAG